MSVRSRSASLKGEDIVQSVQELLEEKRYPPEYSHALSSPIIGSGPYSQKLKDLIINSVSMETTGDTVISSLTGQQPSAADYVVGFKSLLHFLDHEATPNSNTTTYKAEIKQTIVYPLFVCCFLALVAMDEAGKALSLYSSVSDIITQLCTNSLDIKELMMLTSRESLLKSSLAEKFRKHKYISRISDPAFKLLTSFLQAHPTPCLVNLLGKHFSLEVFGSSVPAGSDHKQETKKSLSFVKPQIHPISEIDICLPYARPKPHPLPQPPQPDNESGVIKAEYQQRLVLAAQQLDPSPPSLLLCSITTPTNHKIHCSSLSEKYRLYGYSLDNCSIMVNSWLPTATSGHVSANTESCDILRGHNGPVYGLSFNRSGEFLLSSSEDTSKIQGNIHVTHFINSATAYLKRSMVYTSNCTCDTTCAAFEHLLPSSSCFMLHTLVEWLFTFMVWIYNGVTMWLVKKVRLWDMKSLSCAVVYEGHQHPVWGVSFSPVDGYFTSCSHDSTARLWNTEYVYPLRIFSGHEESVEVARCHPNGNYVATGSLDRTLRLWDINVGNSVRLFTGSKQPIVTLAFSPFGKKLASGGSDGTITLWDISSGRSIMEFKGHTSKITSLSFSSDGTILASCGFDHTVKLWNIKATLGPSYQDLISTHCTDPVLPLTASFIQRNCLVAVGTINNNNRTSKTQDSYYYD